MIDYVYKLNITVENKQLLEIKAVDIINPYHQDQLLTYLKMTTCKLGLLINFQNDNFKSGVTRIVNVL